MPPSFFEALKAAIKTRSDDGQSQRINNTTLGLKAARRGAKAQAKLQDAVSRSLKAQALPRHVTTKDILTQIVQHVKLQQLQWRPVAMAHLEEHTRCDYCHHVEASQRGLFIKEQTINGTIRFRAVHTPEGIVPQLSVICLQRAVAIPRCAKCLPFASIEVQSGTNVNQLSFNLQPAQA